MKQRVPLEPAAEAVCEQSSVPPLIFQLPPEQGRQVLETAQGMPVYKYPADISSNYINTGGWGKIPVYLVAPKDTEIRNVIFYIHGAGWVFGSFHPLADAGQLALAVLELVEDFSLLFGEG